jgi:hypothetical protein
MEYVVGALRKFLKPLRKKRPQLVPGEWSSVGTVPYVTVEAAESR